MAGITSVVFTYPLDIVRTRLSIQSASFAELGARPDKLPGMWATFTSMYKTEGGLSALYRGIIPTVAGVAPYVCLIILAQHARMQQTLTVDRLASTSWYMNQSARHSRLKAIRTLVLFVSFWQAPFPAQLLRPALIHCKLISVALSAFPVCQAACEISCSSSTQRRTATAFPDQYHVRHGIPVQIYIGCNSCHCPSRRY